MKKKSLAFNAVLNALRNGLNILFPLITFPYISRVLDVTGLGKYNFANSIVSYFLLIAGLGINTYAIREGAKLRDDRVKLTHFANQVFSINIISTIVSYVLLLLCLLVIPKLHIYIYAIMIFSIQILFTTIGVEWIYSIYEEYAYITVRSIIFKILSIILLFILVRRKNDYLWYATVTVLATVGSNVLNLINVHKYCDLHFTFHMNLRKHLKPIMIIFSSSIAIMIYVNSDVTILGFLRSDYVVGIYTVSVKIYNVVKTVLSALLIVTIPRLAMLYGKKKYNEYRTVLKDIFNWLLLITLPSVVGLMALSSTVIQIIAGPKYVQAKSSLTILSVALIFSIFGWLFNECVLIPAKREKYYLFATIVSAVVNIVLNLLLINKWSENAAAFSTVIAELLNMVIAVHYSRDIVKISDLLNNPFSILIGCVFIYINCLILQSINLNIFVTLCLAVVSSFIGYFALLIMLKNRNCISIWKYIIRRYLKSGSQRR
ncbi:MAG: flippase [Limosilactobacillus sp.]